MVAASDVRFAIYLEFNRFTKACQVAVTRQNGACRETGRTTLDEYLRRVVFCRGRDFSPDEFRRFIFEQSDAATTRAELEKYGLTLA